ncbi:MAG TPA: CoA-binding protein [Myxococcota bacterium]|nr:CoA-binding protein [Myxococcota bacterium]
MIDLRTLFATTRRIAVLGAHRDPWKPAFYVPDYLHQTGYDILPVNPVLVGETLWGQPVRATLGEVGAVDMVVVFRRSELLPAHLPEILAMQPLPRCVWLQSGIRLDSFVKSMEERGIQVVQDRCSMVEHRRLA